MTDPATKAAEAMREAAAKVAEDAYYLRFPKSGTRGMVAATAIRALPIPEPPPDPRDAAIARAIEFIEEACGYEGEAADVSDRLARAIGRESAKPDPRDATIARLSGDLEAAREALEPFVRAYEPWMDHWPDSAKTYAATSQTFGDERRARAVLAKLAEGA